MSAVQNERKTNQTKHTQPLFGSYKCESLLTTLYNPFSDHTTPGIHYHWIWRGIPTWDCRHTQFSITYKPSSDRAKMHPRITCVKSESNSFDRSKITSTNETPPTRTTAVIPIQIWQKHQSKVGVTCSSSSNLINSHRFPISDFLRYWRCASSRISVSRRFDPPESK
jgi:hypothetical protein